MGQTALLILFRQNDAYAIFAWTENSHGIKAQMACEMAYGEIIVHWDDDDWVFPATHFISGCGNCRATMTISMDTLCGLSRVMFYEPRVQRAWNTNTLGRPWVPSSIFCYYKQFSEPTQLSDMNEERTLHSCGICKTSMYCLP